MLVLLASASEDRTTLADTNRTGMTYLLRVYSIEILLMMTVDMSVTCRVLYQINLRISTSCWFLL